MMNKNTAAAITTARAAFGTREFTAHEWDALHTGTRLETVIFHEAAERIVHTTRRYYTVAELVEELNACAGDDCYYCDWHYEVDADGRAYQDIITATFRMT